MIKFCSGQTRRHNIIYKSTGQVGKRAVELGPYDDNPTSIPQAKLIEIFFVIIRERTLSGNYKAKNLEDLNAHGDTIFPRLRGELALGPTRSSLMFAVLLEKFIEMGFILLLVRMLTLDVIKK